MKTTKLILGVLVLGTLVFLSSCGSGSSSSPAATVKEFSNKVEKGDFDGAIGCISNDGKVIDKDSKTPLWGNCVGGEEVG